jgi:hypothetical protein
MEKENFGLIQISANIPKVLKDKKEFYNVSWARLIREGIRAYETRTILMTGKLSLDETWKEKCEREIREIEQREREGKNAI